MGSWRHRQRQSEQLMVAAFSSKSIPQNPSLCVNKTCLRDNGLIIHLFFLHLSGLSSPPLPALCVFLYLMTFLHSSQYYQYKEAGCDPEMITGVKPGADTHHEENSRQARAVGVTFFFYPWTRGVSHLGQNVSYELLAEDGASVFDSPPHVQLLGWDDRGGFECFYWALNKKMWNKRMHAGSVLHLIPGHCTILWRTVFPYKDQ